MYFSLFIVHVLDKSLISQLVCLRHMQNEITGSLIRGLIYSYTAISINVVGNKASNLRHKTES